MKRPPITLEKWTQTADTVWLDSRTSAVVKTIDRNGQITRANHAADCAIARAIAAVPDLMAAMEGMLTAYYALCHQESIDHKGGENGLVRAVRAARAALVKAGYEF